MIRQHYRILLITFGILLLTIPGLSACYAQPAPTTPAPTIAPIPAPTPTPAPAPAPGSTPTSVQIDISGFAFAPATVTVPIGTTITWTNKDSVVHTVSSQNNVFDSGNLSGGATFSYTFKQSGTFEYYCKFHPNMTGKILVGQG